MKTSYVVKQIYKENNNNHGYKLFFGKSSFMILKIISFIIFILIFQNGVAQTRLCSEYEADHQAEQENPDALKAKAELETFTKQFTQNNQKSEVTYIIPVVFHVLHNYGSENISKAQILDAMRILNEDYNKLNADTVNIIPEFQGIAANIHIQFRLAQIDPNGNCTDGIVRTVTSDTYNANDNTKLLSPSWNRTKYLNIWTANNLESGAAGYSYYPSSVSGAWGVPYDGVISLASYVGSIGTGNYTTARTLTHEVGHFLNLMHPWGSTNNPGVTCGDDGVSDTPITKGHTSCVLTSAVCTSGVIENVQNYMDYSYCDRMFTEGQKTRMRAALNSSISGRNNLWTASNLLATGTNDAYIAQVCTPVPDFSYNKTFGCNSLTVQYSDLTWNVDSGYSLLWSFPGGLPSVSNDTNPIVSYSTAGSYNATLTVTNTSGSYQITKSQIVQVQNSSVGEGIPWTEGFEYNAFPVNAADTNLNWLINGDGNSLWERVGNAFYSGTASAMVNSDLNTSGQTSNLISPNILLGSNPDKHFSFRVSYSQKDINSTDQLMVYVSYNCGQTWYERYNKSGSALSTNGGNYASTWTPTDTSLWRKEILNIYAFLSHPNLRFKFETKSGGGNKIYIDDINLDQLTNIENLPLSVTNNLNIFPNPINNESVLVFDLTQSSDVELTLTNVLGQRLAYYKNNFIAGPYDLAVNKLFKTELQAGVYFLSVNINGKSETLKLIKE